MKLTPGLNFILRGLTRLSLPALSILGVIYVLDDVVGCYQFPLLLKWSLVGAVGPLYAIAQNVWVTTKQDREMRALGAREVPVVRGRWPGSLDVLFHLLAEFRTGYIGLYKSCSFLRRRNAEVERKHNHFGLSLINSDPFSICALWAEMDTLLQNQNTSR